ncbi:hypothetical protein CDIK_4305 [Cucumispora dikerogammari]|nr:hypothetical protein CDIK_4305 [Cucumispora dikerogammari]
MLTLIYNLSSISSYKQPQEHKWLQGDITLCKNSDGKFVDTALFNNKIDYKLGLGFEKRLTVLYVCFRVKIDSLKIRILKYTEQLVRCSENIINHELNNEVVILFDPKTDFYQFRKERAKTSDKDSRYTQITIILDENLNYDFPDSGFDNSGLSSSFWESYDRPKLLTVFRKALGIEDDKIKTTKFKFKIVLTIPDKLTEKIILVHFETKHFSFHQKEDGTLCLVE